MSPIAMLGLLRTLAPWSAVMSLVALALASAELGAPTALAEPSEPPVERQALVSESGVMSRAVGSPTPAAAATCAAGMLPVEGSYCPEVEQRCLRYLDPAKGRFGSYRCAEYAPSRCLSAERRRLSFCIDRDEHVAAGETLPENQVSLRTAEKRCAGEGKRVCRESEWNFACEGEEMLPYPYGLARDASACNADQTDLVDGEGKLRDLRAPPGAHPRCESPFGVRDLSGNLEEVVARDGAGPTRLAMKGAYWQPSKNHCRAAQYEHDAWYHGAETGFRCCADPDPR